METVEKKTLTLEDDDMQLTLFFWKARDYKGKTVEIVERLCRVKPVDGVYISHVSFAIGCSCFDFTTGGLVYEGEEELYLENYRDSYDTMVFRMNQGSKETLEMFMEVYASEEFYVDFTTFIFPVLRAIFGIKQTNFRLSCTAAAYIGLDWLSPLKLGFFPQSLYNQLLEIQK